MNISTHHTYMSLALQLAARGRFTVSPNPMVGCVIVKNGHIVGEGYHQRAGDHHAEIYALQMASDAAKEATAYLTLEPCCHTGKTPPCADALIAAGISKVVVACEDPNPLVAGKGIAKLRAAGITVEVGLFAQQAQKLNEIFFHYITHRRPFVIAKWAMSLDGKTITHPLDSRNISNTKSRTNTHLTRLQTDAILIGAKTAIMDDPLLTVRLDQNLNPENKQPLRIILANHHPLSWDLKMFAHELPGKTMVATTAQAHTSWLNEAKKRGIEVLFINQNAQGDWDLLHLLTQLGERQITSLLVEGGSKTHEQFFAQHLVNKVHVYLAPVIIASLNQKKLVHDLSVTQIENDYEFIADY